MKRSKLSSELRKLYCLLDFAFLPALALPEIAMVTSAGSKTPITCWINSHTSWFRCFASRHTENLNRAKVKEATCYLKYEELHIRVGDTRKLCPRRTRKEARQAPIRRPRPWWRTTSRKGSNSPSSEGSKSILPNPWRGNTIPTGKGSSQEIPAFDTEQCQMKITGDGFTSG